MTGHYPLEVLPWAEKVASADGFIVVTPEYNHGYPAVLKSALDAVHGEWGKKPIAFVGYGAEGGGARCVEQLRQVAVELQMVPVGNPWSFPVHGISSMTPSRLGTSHSTRWRSPCSMSFLSGPSPWKLYGPREFSLTAIRLARH